MLTLSYLARWDAVGFWSAFRPVTTTSFDLMRQPFSRRSKRRFVIGMTRYLRRTPLRPGIWPALSPTGRSSTSASFPGGYILTPKVCLQFEHAAEQAEANSQRRQKPPDGGRDRACYIQIVGAPAVRCMKAEESQLSLSAVMQGMLILLFALVRPTDFPGLRPSSFRLFFSQNTIPTTKSDKFSRARGMRAWEVQGRSCCIWRRL